MNMKIQNVERVPMQEDEELGMPTFRVSGTWKGEKFVYDVSMELDGRDAEWEHKEGLNLENSLGDQWIDEQDAIFTAISESGLYKEALEEYHRSLE